MYDDADLVSFEVIDFLLKLSLFLFESSETLLRGSASTLAACLLLIASLRLASGRLVSSTLCGFVMSRAIFGSLLSFLKNKRRLSSVASSLFLSLRCSYETASPASFFGLLTLPERIFTATSETIGSDQSGAGAP